MNERSSNMPAEKIPNNLTIDLNSIPEVNPDYFVGPILPEEHGAFHDNTESNFESVVEEKSNAQNNEEIALWQSGLDSIQQFIESPTNENDPRVMDILEESTNNLASLGDEAEDLVSTANEGQRLRLEKLQHELRFGLQNTDLPFSNLKKSEVQPTALWFEYDPINSQYMRNFQVCLDMLGSGPHQNNEMDDFQKHFGEYESALSTAIKLKEELEKCNINPSQLVRTPMQRKGWLILAFGDSNKPYKLEIELTIQGMKQAYLKHKDVLEQLNSDENKYPPYTKPLVEDVAKFHKELRCSIEEIPTTLSSEQKQVLQKFLPALDEFYKDRIDAIVGNECYVPLAGRLKQVQEAVFKSRSLATILEASKDLDQTMQRLYLLHWVAESLIKAVINEKQHLHPLTKKGEPVYHVTAGSGLYSIRKNTSPLLNSLEDMQGAITFRNEIAHKGLVWAPEDFKVHIKNYEQGIDILSQHFSISLAEVSPEIESKRFDKRPHMKKMHEKLQQEFGIDINLAQKYARKLLENSLSDYLSFETNPEALEQKTKLIHKFIENGEFLNTEYGVTHGVLKNKLLKNLDSIDLSGIKIKADLRNKKDPHGLSAYLIAKLINKAKAEEFDEEYKKLSQIINNILGK